MSNASNIYSNNLKISTTRDSANTLDLRVGTVPPKDGIAQRWLVMCNGRTEWVEKYSHLPEDLQISRSTGFLTWDHRGQGGSGGARAWIDDYAHYSRDAAVVIDGTTQGRPYNLICHSMGGLIALHGVLTGLLKPRCLVLSSPLLGLPSSSIKPATAYKISSLCTALGLGHVASGGGSHSKPSFDRNILTHSAQRFEAIRNTPFPLSSATFQWIKSSYEAMLLIRDPDMLKRLTIPTLVISGTGEEVVDVNAVVPWVNLARQHAPAAIDLQWIQDARHELLFESKPYYDRTISLIREWFMKVDFPV